MIQKDSKVSLLIPAFNAGNYIGQTIDSLLNQTFENIELIIVDDGSTDNTASIINSFNDSRILYHLQDNSGAAAARNTAYKLCSGDYIKFIDADDLLNTNCLAEQVASLKSNPGYIASSKWGRFNKDDLSDFVFVPEPVWKTMSGCDWIVESLLEYGRNMTQPGIFLIPRALIEQEGLWDESLSLIDDFEFMTRIITAAKEVVFCPEAILYYRSWNEGTLSTQYSSKHLESARRAQFKGIDTILSRVDTKKSRLACANSLQLWAFGFYQKHDQLFEEFESKIKELGGSNLQLEGGNALRWMSRILGWKKTLYIKNALNKITG